MLDGFAERMSMILGALTVVLTVAVIGLVVKVRKLQKAHTGRVPNTQRTENLDSGDLKDAALSVCSASEKEVEAQLFTVELMLCHINLLMCFYEAGGKS
ncbi:hypothetical protein INR49_027970 [Caranx melampygus]|nr:hypothetical protein INR49_027970 [Caranx melampygus]